MSDTVPLLHQGFGKTGPFVLDRPREFTWLMDVPTVLLKTRWWLSIRASADPFDEVSQTIAWLV